MSGTTENGEGAVTVDPDSGSGSRLIRLYPEGYRLMHGAELAAIHAEVTAGAGPMTRFREATDIVGHALRVRLGTTSADRGGRIAAAALPCLLGVLGGAMLASLIYDLIWWSDVATEFRELGSQNSRYLTWGGQAAIAVAAVCATVDRWRIGRFLTLLGLACLGAPIVRRYSEGAMDDRYALLSIIFLLALVAAAPQDLPPTGRRNMRSIVCIGLATGIPMGIAFAVRVPSPLRETYWLWPFLVVAAVMFLALLNTRDRERHTRAGGALLILLPMLLVRGDVSFRVSILGPVATTAWIAGALAVGAAVAGLARTARRRMPD
jgi:hypothetical protein